MEEMRPPGADDGTRAQPESADGAVGLGYSLPVWKKNFQGAEASSSSMNFISFTKAGTNLDGSQSSARNDYEAKNVCIDVSKLKLVGHIPPAEILEAKTLVEKIHINLKRIINSPINQNNSLTTNFSNSIQVLKVNPVYVYTCLRDVNIDNIPPGFKTNFYGKVYEGGYLCEVRVKNIFFSIGIGGSKIGARDKAIQNALKVMDILEVSVDVRPRQWGDQAFPQLVLINQRFPRRVMPVFFQPPEGTKEHELARRAEEKQKARKRKFNDEQISILKNPNIAHMGPSSSGIQLENFVIIYKMNENPISVLGTSAMFCKMAVDFFFEEIPSEKPNAVDNWVCTAFIEGEAVADGRGVKKTLKHRVANSALECLGKICYTVLMNNGMRSVNQNNIMSRRDVKTSGEQSAEEARLGEDNVGNRMLQMMGWREGQGLGNTDSIVDPVKVKENFNRAGLGQAINSDNIQREEAEEIIRKYAASDELEDLSFSSELLYDERKEIAIVAKKYGLVCRRANHQSLGRKQTFLIISKKVGPEVIIDQLEKEGSWGKYELARPAVGDRSVILQYLHFQHLRRCQGFPPELQELARLTDPCSKHTAPPARREPSETVTSGSGGPHIKPLLPEGIVKRGKISSAGLKPLMSGPCFLSPTLNTEDSKWESYRNMELNRPRPSNSRNHPPWGEESFSKTPRYSPWARKPEHLQDPFSSDETYGSFGAPSGFGGYDYAPDSSDQFWSRMNGYLGNNIAKAASALHRGRGRGRGRGQRY